MSNFARKYMDSTMGSQKTWVDQKPTHIDDKSPLTRSYLTGNDNPRSEDRTAHYSALRDQRDLSLSNLGQNEMPEVPHYNPS